MAANVVSDAVPATIRRLRRRIERDPTNPDSLLTEYGRGWRLILAKPSPESTPTRPLFGRKLEIEAIHSRWRDTRLQTLVGPGGVGKTALAHVVSPRGTVFIDLSSAYDESGVLQAIRAVFPRLHLGTEDKESLRTLVARRMQGAPLVVFDNADTAIDIILPWIQALGDLNILVTSRIPMGTAEEYILQVASLNPSAAMALFRHRYQQAGGTAPLDESALLAVVQSIDCLPLALELVAPRAVILSLDDLMRDLHARIDAIPTLAGTHRHRGIRPCLQSSWDRLTPELGLTMGAISLFSAEFELADAEALTGHSCLESIEQLVRQSMVNIVRPGRFRLLALVRAYGLEQAEEHYRAAHTQWVLGRLRQLGFGRTRSAGLNALLPDLLACVTHETDEQAIVEAALGARDADWLAGINARSTVLRDALKRVQLPSSIARLTLQLAYDATLYDPRYSIELLESCPEHSYSLLELEIRSRGCILGFSGPVDVDHWRRCIEEESDLQSKARTLNQLACHLRSSLDYEGAYSAAVRALEATRKSGNIAEEAYALQQLASACVGLGEIDRAISFSRRSLETARNSGFYATIIQSESQFATICAALDRDLADEIFGDVARKLMAQGLLQPAAHFTGNRGVNAWLNGDKERCLTLLDRLDFQLLQPSTRSYFGAFREVARHEFELTDGARLRQSLSDLARTGRPALAELLAICTLPEDTHRTVDEILAPFGDATLRADLTSAREIARKAAE